MNNPIPRRMADIMAKLPASFRDIDIWDEKYDYVMHDDHWLTSKWSADCEKCRNTQRRPESPVINHNTNNNNGFQPKSVAVNNIGSTMTKAPQPIPAPSLTTDKTNTTLDNLTNAVSNINLTSSPARNSMSITLKNNDSTRHTYNMDISPPPAVPPPVTIAMTPIAHPSISARAFVTPYTSSKFGNNETFNRTTRQSAKKLLNQNANQELIDLNETFDLYRSCLAETPQLSQHSSPQHDNIMQQQQPLQPQNHNQQQQGSSRIPKIPVRLPK